jgi:hypothetical protein
LDHIYLQIDFARQQNEEYIEQDDRFESLKIGISRCLKTLNQKGAQFPLARNELRKLEHVREMLGEWSCVLVMEWCCVLVIEWHHSAGECSG